jgi:hypothetical protein
VNLYKVGNCGESTDVMISELNKNYPKMIVENVSIETPDHVFSVLNRDQSTSIFMLSSSLSLIPLNKRKLIKLSLCCTITSVSP